MPQDKVAAAQEIPEMTADEKLDLILQQQNDTMDEIADLKSTIEDLIEVVHNQDKDGDGFQIDEYPSDS